MFSVYGSSWSDSNKCMYVCIVRPQSTVEYTSVASVSTEDCGLTKFMTVVVQMLSGYV